MRRLHPHTRIIIASCLLLAGVALVTTTAETRTIWWAVPGYLLLCLVPALIYDAAVDTMIRLALDDGGGRHVAEPERG